MPNKTTIMVSDMSTALLQPSEATSISLLTPFPSLKLLSITFRKVKKAQRINLETGTASHNDVREEDKGRRERSRRNEK